MVKAAQPEEEATGAFHLQWPGQPSNSRSFPG